MPGKIKVKVLAGRNLPVMDRASDTTDAFVEIKFGGVTHKTDVCRKSLNPHWSSTEWYRFEVDESELQDEPLQLRLMDHDTYSANDAIGKVVISLAPLLAREANNAKGTTGPPGGAVLSGWIPVFDTMHGIRGELNIIVKVELFSDFNKYKTSSCGVQFFHCPMIPPGYKATSIHGFVEELVVNDDPEYQWIDKIRTPRASNEARQVAFIKLSNQVQRLVGLKAAELGANAVVGYQQEFDLEGEAGVVARAIGTAVSITPMPTPSQPVNMISCTQQQLKKCLDILATDDESVTDLSQYYKHHQEELLKMINLLNPKGLSMLDSQENPDDDEERVELVRQSSLNSYAGSVSLYQDDYVSRNSLRHLSEDQTDLNRLLNRKEDDDSDSSGPIQKIKKLKTNFFTKRFTKRKGEKKNEKQDDAVSLKSNSSDTSRISLYDIKNELKKFKRLKKPKFVKSINKEDEGEGMASILARSVIHARTTLACITETQDSQAENSPSSTLRRTSESDPNMYIEDEKTKQIPVQENVEMDIKKVPEIQFSSLKNISSEDLPVREPRVRRLSESCPTSPMAGRSDNLLKLPGDKGYYGSVSSALSGESSIYSSSEDEDESSDLKTDTDDALETTSSIVKTVMRNEADPAFIAQMDRKLTVIQNTPPKISESILADFDKRIPHSVEAELEKIETSRSPEKEIKKFECKIEKATDDAEKVEPAVATNEPSTSKDAENERLEEHKNSGATMRQLQSTTASTTPRIVAVTPKRLSEDLTANVDKLIDKKYQEESKVPEAVEVVRMDKTQAVLPEPEENINHRQLYEEFEKETAMHKKKDSRGSISTLMDKVHFHPHFFHHKKDGSSHDIKSGGLIQAAMQTMLIDRAQSMIPDTPDPIPIHAEPDFGEIGKHHKHHEDDHDHKNKESTGLIHSALQTMLIDNVQSVLPDSDEPIPIRTAPDFGEESHKTYDHSKNKESTGLVHSALQTMLIDNVQSVLPDSDEPIPIKTESVFGEESHKSHGHTKDKDCTGLVHSALQTMLIDSVQSVLPDLDEPIPIRTEPIFDDTTSQKSHNSKESTGLVHSALQTMLIDNIHSVLPDLDEPIPIRTEPNFDDTKSQKSYGKEKESTGLVHSALETMLIDNVKSVLPDSNKPIPIRFEQIFNDESSQKSNRKESESKSKTLVNTAMETILLDRMQTMFPKVPEANKKETRNEEIKDEFSELKSTGLVKNALILIDKVQPLFGSDKAPLENNNNDKNEEPIENNDATGQAQPEINISKILKEHYGAIDPKFKKNQTSNKEEDSKLKSWSEDSKDNISDPTNYTNEVVSKHKETDEIQKKETENRNKEKKEKNDFEERKKHFTRQDSFHSVTSNKMSHEPNKHKVNKALLQHFHPLLSGGLETIPSVDCNDSFDHSIDETSARTSGVVSVEGSFDRSDAASAVATTEPSVDRAGETNTASVCDNSHAACRFDRERERERDRDRDRSEKESPKHARHESYGGREPPAQNSSLNASSTPMGIHRRSSDSDLSVTPKGGSLNTSVGNNVGGGGGAILRPSMNSNNLDMLEYPFLTMTEYPPGFIVHIGGAVCARSVKLVDGGGESAARAAWWTELRIELRAHARALRCNAVIAYRDTAAICEDVCVLSASGTAVVINLDCDFNADIDAPITVPSGSKAPFEENEDSCSIAHVPYSPGAGPYRAELSTCGGCRRARVPAVLLAACAKPDKLAAYPKSVTLTAVAARIRRAPPSAEPGARDISDQLPFLEYELHKLLLAKLRMQGANAIFSLQTQIAIGERCVMALASGQAVKLTALPPPTPPRIKASEKEKDAIEMQKALWDTFTANRAANGFDVAGIPELTTYGALPELEGEEPPSLDLCADKDACVLELDEAEDVETARALSKRRVHLQAFNNSLRPAPGAQPLAFTQVSRCRMSLGAGGGGCSAAAERQVARALDAAAYKLRRLAPAALHAAFHIELPEDEIQLTVSGTAIPLADPSKPEPSENGHSLASHSSQSSQNCQSSQNSQTDGNDDDIFELDEEQMKPVLTAQEMVEDKSVVNGHMGSAVSLSTARLRGAGRRLCALRLLFVRETTAVRELGGLSGFLHTFTCEVLAILRAYTAALGGNTLTSFYITQLMLQDNAHKNQGQCLLSVGGDVVHV